MIAEYTEHQTNDTLRYLNGLFDLQKYIHENKMQDKTVSDISHYEKFLEIERKVKAVMERSKYNKVDLSSIFSFMRVSKA